MGLCSKYDTIRFRSLPSPSLRFAPEVVVFALVAGSLLFSTPGFSQSAKSGAPGAQSSAPADTSQSVPPPAKPVTVHVFKPVTLTVTVRDKKGRPDPNLSKDDFTLQQDGRPQSITSFVQDGSGPMTVGILIDTTSGQHNLLDQERTASKSFLDQTVQSNDHAFVVHFDKDVELLQDVTADHGKLDSAVQLLQTQYEQQSPNPNNQDGSANRRGGTTLLYDSIFLGCDELMKKQTGRKAIVVISDGVDRGSKESLVNAIEAAQRSGTMVYAVYFSDHERSQNPFNRRNGGGNQGQAGD